jgi:hypothetical protein
MIYSQHTDPTCCIPQHISKYGLYSAHLFLLVSPVNYYYGYKLLCLIGLLLYISSVLHWRKVKQGGFYKTFDVITCIITLTYITFYASLEFCLKHRMYWFASAIAGLVSYGVNKYIEINQTVLSKKTKSVVVFDKDEPYKYLSLKYTVPNTPQRESAYKYSVFMHICFLHVNYVVFCTYGVVNSSTCSS